MARPARRAAESYGPGRRRKSGSLRRRYVHKDGSFRATQLPARSGRGGRVMPVINTGQNPFVWPCPPRVCVRARERASAHGPGSSGPGFGGGRGARASDPASQRPSVHPSVCPSVCPGLAGVISLCQGGERRRVTSGQPLAPCPPGGTLMTARAGRRRRRRAGKAACRLAGRAGAGERQGRR